MTVRESGLRVWHGGGATQALASQANDSDQVDSSLQTFQLNTETSAGEAILAKQRDSQASINAYNMCEFREKVVASALNQLRPVPREQVGGPTASISQIAHNNSHNSLCYEMRLSFALTIGAAFERNLRLWLSLGREELRPKIERANRTSLLKYFAELKGPCVASILQSADIVELWELVSTARHGDGPAAKRLKALNPELWSHQDRATQLIYDKVGLRAHSIRIRDADLERYFDATIGFWTRVARR